MHHSSDSGTNMFDFIANIFDPDAVDDWIDRAVKEHEQLWPAVKDKCQLYVGMGCPDDDDGDQHWPVRHQEDRW